jgi:hypothetical protein
MEKAGGSGYLRLRFRWRRGRWCRLLRTWLRRRRPRGWRVLAKWRFWCRTGSPAVRHYTLLSQRFFFFELFLVLFLAPRLFALLAFLAFLDTDLPFLLFALFFALFLLAAARLRRGCPAIPASTGAGSASGSPPPTCSSSSSIQPFVIVPPIYERRRRWPHRLQHLLLLPRL